MINCLDPSIRFIGRWYVIDRLAVATAPGSHFQFAFKGRQAVMHFQTDLLLKPFPHLWISVDGGAMVEAQLDKKLRIQAANDGNHVVEVIFKSAIEQSGRWFYPMTGRIDFRGYEADAPGQLPPAVKKTIEFVGDSITEGVLIDWPSSNDLTWLERPMQDDSTATYAWLAAQELGLEPYIMGYGGVGVTSRGSGAVPKVQESYPYCFLDTPIPYSNCDYIVIHHGTNDANASLEDFRTGYTALLDVITGHNPESRIFVLTPFCGVWQKELPEIVSQYNARTGADITCLCTDGWLNSERIHPDREGHARVGKALAEALRAHGV